MTAPAPVVHLPAFDEIERIYEAQHAHRSAAGPAPAAERAEKLRRLERAVMARRGEIRAAMWDDYRKPAAEVDLSEIYPVVSEAKHAARHLRSWTKPHRVPTRLALLGSQSKIIYEPKGLALIISPWNFPFNLSLGPLISAIAAGNSVILKPSEMTPASAACIKGLLAEVFDDTEVAVIEGDATVAEALLRKKFDHIFFTGSPAVGKLVMKAAAEHLTSVTLELGGKSPVIVDRTADLDEAAEKIAWGKFFNCGQVCIAPDYVLVDESVRVPFLEKLKSATQRLGSSRGIIVNDRHAARVKRLFDATMERGATLVTGGGFRGREIEPTVITDVAESAPVLHNEIFGPILPVLTYRSLDDAFAAIGAKEKPLVLYAFSRDRGVVKEILARTSAGGTVVNHTMIHFYQLNLPFGGVGHSGVGKGHGFYGFEAFSNARAVVDQRTRRSPIGLLYPPYAGKLKQKLIDFTVKWL